MSVSVADAPLELEREQISGLAPDHATTRSADDLARGDRWGATGRSIYDPAGDLTLLWAEFPETRRDPTRTLISIPCLRAACTCAATRYPCRHVIALLLRNAAEPFAAAALPEWAAELFRDHHGEAQPADPVAEEARTAALVAGMAELKKWLGDLALRGLNDLPKRGRAPWLTAADRLTDAYAFEIAGELRELAIIPGSSDDWAERLLPRLGRLALLCEAFERFDTLTHGERGDALAAAGFPHPPDDDRVEDLWVVVGRRQENTDRQVRSRTWLFGLSAGRWALLTGTYAAGHAEGQCLPTGAVFSGAVAYHPGVRSVLASPVDPLRLVESWRPATNNANVMDLVGTSIDEGIARYSAALTANPWLRAYPMPLREVYCEPPGADNTWRLRDRGGWLLPLPPKFAHGWHLLSLTADRPMTLFGEWDGARFTPLSVLDGRWRSISGWRGIP